MRQNKYTVYDTDFKISHSFSDNHYCELCTFVWLSGMFFASRCGYYWLLIGRSSPAHVAAFPGLPSATGRVPFGRPVGSSRTLTTGLGTSGPEPTVLCGEEAGSSLPVPGDPSGRRRRIYTCHIVDVVRLVYAIRTFCFPIHGRGPGFRTGPTYFGLGP